MDHANNLKLPSARARAWRDGAHAAICDKVEPWAHGTVVRASRFPSYFDFNTVRVEDDPGIDFEELASFADRALSGLAHRRVDFDCLDAAERRRAEFERRGWRATSLLWMRHEGPAPGQPDNRVAAAPYEAPQQLRVLWQHDFGDYSPSFHDHAREVALKRGALTLVVRAGDEPVAFAQLERDGAGAEITQVYVHPDHRGRGLGTAITRAAIAQAADATDLWICADAEERAKEIYARLGFVTAWKTMNFLRPPEAPR